MDKVLEQKEVAISRISEVINHLIQQNTFFQENLKKDELIQAFSKLIDKVSLEEIISLNDEELIRRVGRVMVRESVAGTLNDLTPEERETFEAAVEGR
jgi:hypothetical protein